ncbi:MAG: dTMP kinase [Xylophilus ampelinus]
MPDPTPPTTPDRAAAPRFLSFEGIDGAGKSTHIAGLADAFRAQGRTVVLTREPGGTALAEKLRALVLQEAMDPLTEALLVFAARRDHLRQVIEPALARGAVVLCDRFTDATFAYQGGGRGFDLGILRTLERWVQGRDGAGEGADAGEGQGSAVLRQPDLTLWFDLPPAEAAARLAGARSPDRFESQSEAFFRRVAVAYAARAAAEPGRFARIDAAGTPDAVSARVFAAVAERGWLDAADAERASAGGERR